MKATIALYRHTEYGNTSANLVINWIEKSADYIRITEPVEIEFAPRKQDEMVAEQVDALERKADEIEATAREAIANIKARIQELRALPAPESA